MARQGQPTLRNSRTLADSRWVATAVLALVACSSNSETWHEPAPEDSVDQVHAALSTADACGEPCGGGLLAPGEACCRNGAEDAYAVDQECCTPTGVQPKHPIADLSACPNRVPHPGHTPSFYNCSIPGWVPNSIQNFTGLFLPACRDHDICYDTCGTNRAACDRGFRDTALAACELTFANDPWTRRRCRNRAFAFFAGVRAGGRSFFSDAQKLACDCCAGDASCTVAEADLSVTPVAIPSAPVAPGDGVQFQFYVNNQGPGAATDVSASIDFTSGLTQPNLIVYAPGAGAVACGVVALSGGGNLATCTVPRLEPGETATIEGSATTTVPGQEVAAVFVSAQPPENAEQKLDNYAEATWVVECPQGTTWDAASQRCDCVPQPGSLTPTPSIDEDCDGQMDNSTSGFEWVADSIPRVVVDNGCPFDVLGRVGDACSPGGCPSTFCWVDGTGNVTTICAGVGWGPGSFPGGSALCQATTRYH